MGKFSKSDFESKGWVFVTGSDDENADEPARAEKQYNGRLLNEEAHSMGLLLERLNAYEAHLEGLPENQPSELDESGVPKDAAGLPIRSVIVPGGETLTEEEWRARDTVDAIYEDGEMVYRSGGTEAAAEAAIAIQAMATEEDNQEHAEPDVGETEMIETQSVDHQLEDVLIVRKGEEDLGDVIARKEDQSAKDESDRVEAGMGIGPDHPSEFGQEVHPDDEIPKEVTVEEPTGPEPAEPPAEPEPAPEPPAEEPPAEPEAEAPTEIIPPEEVPATPAAEAKAEELGVDISKIDGSGVGGKVTVPDVEAAASPES